MLARDEIHRLFRQGDIAEVHRQLDAAMPGETPNDQHSIASWRAWALMREERYDEALDHLSKNREDFGSKTDVHHTRASIFDVLGRDDEALHELRTAPFETEKEKYGPLVTDAKFYLLHFMAKRKMPIDPAALDEIPDGYRSILPQGQRIYGVHVSKQDLAEIDRAALMLAVGNTGATTPFAPNAGFPRKS